MGEIQDTIKRKTMIKVKAIQEIDQDKEKITTKMIIKVIIIKIQIIKKREAKAKKAQKMHGNNLFTQFNYQYLLI